MSNGEKKKPGRPPKSQKGKGKDAAQKNPDNMPMPTHLFVGYRDVKVKLEKPDYERVMKAQQALQREVDESGEHLLLKQKQIDEAEEVRSRRKAEYREIEDIIEAAKDKIGEIIKANADGCHIERMEVDEVFMAGEIVTYKKGTQEEVGERRNATPAEWAAAQEVRDEKGRPVSRFQAGKPVENRPGFVVIDGGKDGKKEVPATADGMGYIGPQEDPKTKPKNDRKKKDKKPREPKTLPASLQSEPEDDDDADTEGDDNGGPAAS